MRVAISGSSGFIGSALVGSLVADGHEVVRLVRREPVEANEVRWDPDGGRITVGDLEGVDGVVNLSGAGVGDRRWTSSYKRVILASRTNATRTLAETMNRLAVPPRVFVSVSGIGYYGNHHGGEFLDEEDPPGADFMAMVCQEWEAAAEPATAAGVAVCNPRLGIVMNAKGGALAEFLPFFKLGLGGPLGGGDQYWSYVSLADTVRAIRFLLETPGCTGPYNVTAPEPVTNAELSRVLARTLSRPMFLAVPEFAVKIRLGELSEHVLASARVVPTRLLEAGFSFDHPNARAVMAAAVR